MVWILEPYEFYFWQVCLLDSGYIQIYQETFESPSLTFLFWSFFLLVKNVKKPFPQPER